MLIQDLLDTLLIEFAAIRNDLAEFAPSLLDCGVPADQPDAPELFAEQLERCTETAMMLELTGLAAGCSHATCQARGLGKLDSEACLDAVVWQDEWLALILEYLTAPSTEGLTDRMVLHLADPRSGEPMEEAALAEVHSAFSIVPTLPLEFTEQIRSEAETIDEADASLAVPGDVDPRVYDAFLSDSPEYARRFSKCIAALIDGESSAQNLKEARRIAHSLKGSANIVGVKGLAKLAHRLEDVLDYLATLAEIPELPDDLKCFLLDSADALEQMLAFLRGEEAPPTAPQILLQRACDWAFRLEQDGLAFKKSTPPPAQSNTSGAMLVPPDARPTALAKQFPTAPPPPAPEPGSHAAAEEEATLRVPVKTIDQMFRYMEDMATGMAHLQLSLKEARQRHAMLIHQSQNVGTRIHQMEELVHQRSSLMHGKETRSLIDPLELHQYSELQNVCQRLVEATGDYRRAALETAENLTGLDAKLGKHERLGKDLQYLAAGVRMLPLSTLSARLERNVRQTCRTTGKLAALHIFGDHIKVDSDVLNKLAEPLMHLLRNAIDHGIETSEERMALGKDRQGHLALQFSQHGQTVEVRCIDDGRGYDFDRIREKAIAAGLMEENASLSEHELAQLTMQPGFTTSSAVTEVSGRGVGMDIVQARVQAMHGDVVVKSKRGEGTEVRLQFQASLVTLHTLLVRVGASTFAIPSHIIELVIPRGSALIAEVDGKRHLTYLARQYDHHHLAALIGMASNPDHEADGKPALLIRRDKKSIALTVDELLDSQQSLVKDMGKYMQNIHGVSGAVMRADGTVAPLLDVSALLAKPVDHALIKKKDLDVTMGRSILIVDDSPSVRRSLSLLLEDAGYAVTTARDGMEAIAMIKASKPDLVLTDLEMPVLNGLELTQHLRARPETVDLPIVMITSRSMDKHREMADQAGVSMYLTKPWVDDELLDMVAVMLLLLP